MSKQASDLDITVNNMLPAIRGTKALVETIKTMIPYTVATTSNGSAYT
jgi:hypothetical protein